MRVVKGGNNDNAGIGKLTCELLLQYIYCHSPTWNAVITRLKRSNVLTREVSHQSLGDIVWLERTIVWP